MCTMDKVYILSALAEVAMEREDLETSLSDYTKSLSILEHLVEPDSRHIAELKPFHTARALYLFARQRLKNESKNVSESTSSSSSASGSDKQAEIETLTGLASDLEKKLEDLQQLASSTQSILSQLLGTSASKSKGNESSFSSLVPPQRASASITASENGNFDAPRISTAQASGSSGVTHLVVVGRGVKRVVMSSTTVEPSPSKKPALDSTEDKKE